jgi:hypothetical protein
VAQQQNPWTVEDKAAKLAMQKIWQAVYKKSIPYQITTDGPVFAVVSICILHVLQHQSFLTGPAKGFGCLAVGYRFHRLYNCQRIL